MTETIWFVFFWTFLIGLMTLEWLLDSSSTNVSREKRWPPNIATGLLNGAIASVLPVGLIWFSSWAADNDFGLLNLFQASLWIAVPATILVLGLGQYLFHRLMHQVPQLWAIHKVHHCDRHLDASTGLRFHPLEMLLNLAFMAPVVVLAGLDTETLAASEILAIFVGVFSHTSVELPRWMDRPLRLLFITPALHALHHSDMSTEYNSNFGAVYSFWDRIFGTYLAKRVREREWFRVGVDGVDADEATDLRRLLSMPWIRENSDRSE